MSEIEKEIRAHELDAAALLVMAKGDPKAEAAVFESLIGLAAQAISMFTDKREQVEGMVEHGAAALAIRAMRSFEAGRRAAVVAVRRQRKPS
jgi:hypothetical protein